MNCGCGKQPGRLRVVNDATKASRLRKPSLNKLRETGTRVLNKKNYKTTS